MSILVDHWTRLLVHYRPRGHVPYEQAIAYGTTVVVQGSCRGKVAPPFGPPGVQYSRTSGTGDRCQCLGDLCSGSFCHRCHS